MHIQHKYVNIYVDAADVYKNEYYFENMSIDIQDAY